MERLHYNFAQWYALPTWERDLRLAREIWREHQVDKLIEATRSTTDGKINAQGLNAILLMRSQLL